MSKHTPGPWTATKGHDACWDIRAPDVGLNPWDVATVIGYCGYENDTPANARLIAAAPDLLELAKLVHGSFGGGRTVTFSDADIAAFEAAIAKAEGRT